MFDEGFVQNKYMSTNPLPASPPSAPRLKKPSWHDPRLLVGILIVCVSVAGVVALVNTADQTVDVYSIEKDLPVGSKVTEEDLSVVGVRLGAAESSYVTVAEGLPERAMAISMLHGDELLTESAVGTADELDRQPVGLLVRQPLSAEAIVGSFVDVWVSRQGESRRFEEPQLLLKGVEVASREDSESALGGTNATTVQVLVKEEKMGALLDAVSNEAKIAVIPNPGGAE